MAEDNRMQGFGTKEALLALLVLAIAVAIILPLAVRTQNKNLLLNETIPLRQVFYALDQYETENDNQPAPNLAALFPQVDPNRADFLSGLDPFVRAKAPVGGFPLDPGLENAEKSPFRISFSYLQNFARAGKISVLPWAQAKFDANLGELADEWYGSVQPGSPFKAQVSGRLMRINTDGSVFILQNRGGPKPLGDAQDLFIKR
jgi:hypothetical protein